MDEAKFHEPINRNKSPTTGQVVPQQVLSELLSGHPVHVARIFARIHFADGSIVNKPIYEFLTDILNKYKQDMGEAAYVGLIQSLSTDLTLPNRPFKVAGKGWAVEITPRVGPSKLIDTYDVTFLTAGSGSQ
jgi:hypothetical protein